MTRDGVRVPDRILSLGLAVQALSSAHDLLHSPAKHSSPETRKKNAEASPPVSQENVCTDVGGAELSRHVGAGWDGSSTQQTHRGRAIDPGQVEVQTQWYPAQKSPGGGGEGGGRSEPEPALKGLLFNRNKAWQPRGPYVIKASTADPPHAALSAGASPVLVDTDLKLYKS